MAMVTSSPRSCSSSSASRRTDGPAAPVGVVAVGQADGRAGAGDGREDCFRGPTIIGTESRVSSWPPTGDRALRFSG
jgi:hypothetical protein